MATIVGTAKVETLNGTAADDTFQLEGGTDTVNGNGGLDTVNLSDAAVAVNVNLATGVMSGWGSATLNGITQIYGGWHGGVLTGNANTTYIAAPGGDTTVNAGSSSTTIILGAGNDTVHGGAGNDEIYVATDVNTIAGNNAIDGGGGYNGVSYVNASGYVTVDLYAGAWHPGGHDSLTNIVNIQGSNFGNTLKGDFNNNIIVGGSGNDVIEGREGNDVLTGGLGADLFVMDTGTGNTVITDFSHGQGDQIDLSAYGLHSFAAVQALMHTSGADTVITLGGGSVTLQGDSSVSASDFANLGTESISLIAGVKTAVFSGSLGQYSISVSNSTSVPATAVTVTDNVAGRDGTNVLTGVQQAQFTDDTVVFDLHSSQDLLVYEIYQAAYARMPDNGGYRYWAAFGDNTGASATLIADQFLVAPEFSQRYGANPTNSQYVTALYTNVLGRTPDQSGLDYWIGQANAGQPRDQLLVDFATSQENVQLIGGHISNGFWTTHA